MNVPEYWKDGSLLYKRVSLITILALGISSLYLNEVNRLGLRDLSIIILVGWTVWSIHYSRYTTYDFTIVDTECRGLHSSLIDIFSENDIDSNRYSREIPSNTEPGVDFIETTYRLNKTTIIITEEKKDVGGNSTNFYLKIFNDEAAELIPLFVDIFSGVTV